MLPFIYIAALRRTGSTVLSEALTALPHSFILHEPQLAGCGFSFHPSLEALRESVNLHAFQRRRRIPAGVRRRLGFDRGYMVRAFKSDVCPKLAPHVAQLGVKEVEHSGWRHYQASFPDMKVVLTARDPRDIYLSMYGRVQKGIAIWNGPFEPARVAAALNREFEHQREMTREQDCFRACYEDACTNPALFSRLKEFLGSPIPEIGRIGGFNAVDPLRSDEAALHGDRMTDQRIQRWKREPDPALRAQAEQMLDLMPAFCDFWGYAPTLTESPSEVSP